MHLAWLLVLFVPVYKQLGLFTYYASYNQSEDAKSIDYRYIVPALKTLCPVDEDLICVSHLTAN